MHSRLLSGIVRSSMAPVVVIFSSVGIEGCGDPADPLIDSSTHPIVDGVQSPAAQDATVMLTDNGKNACTATLVAPNLVLTARHCVSNVDDNRGDCGVMTADLPPRRLAIALGVQAKASNVAARATRLFVPGPVGRDSCGDDIALVQLDRDIGSVVPRAVRFTPLEVGETTVAIGYGDNGHGKDTPGRFQRTGVKVTAVGPSKSGFKTKAGASVDEIVRAGEVETTEATCDGDSGGPLLDAEGRIAGVNSRGLDSCIDQPGYFTAMPRHERLIRDAAAAAGHPVLAPY